MRKNKNFGNFFAIVLILIGLSFLLPININFNAILILIILDVIAMISSIINKEYIKSIYLIGVFIVLFNNTNYLNINFLANTNMFVAIIGLTFIYLGIKNLLGK